LVHIVISSLNRREPQRKNAEGRKALNISGLTLRTSALTLRNSAVKQFSDRALGKK